uniref:Tetratricopeptide repeat protein 13 isoform X1 n=1 Tax=Petromyzon marinus TaxID=7757 RepID=A0AAJ7SRI5_PETMA|nr:tetratricopeptide repeat protein 13 isoform X1 [Petromyzon marinus]
MAVLVLSAPPPPPLSPPSLASPRLSRMPLLISLLLLLLAASSSSTRGAEFFQSLPLFGGEQEPGQVCQQRHQQQQQHQQQQPQQQPPGQAEPGTAAPERGAECGERWSRLPHLCADAVPVSLRHDFPVACDSVVSCEQSSINNENFLSQAVVLAEQRKFPFPSGVLDTDRQLAYGFVLIHFGLNDEAIKHFTSLLQDTADLVSAVYGRAIAYARKGLQDIENMQRALADFDQVLQLQPEAAYIYEQRAELLSPLGRTSEAMADCTRAIALRPSARLYLLRGTFSFMSEDYPKAYEDFQKSLELDMNQPVAMHYKGLTFYHRGKLREAVDTFKDALRLKSDYTDVYRSLGQAYRELGDFEAAMESFQKALLLNQKHVLSLQLRGIMLYHHGEPSQALNDFKRCLQLEPSNEVCQYMKGLSHVALGQFYEGVKAQTKVMLNEPLPGQKASPEYLRVKYLREYSRYLHANLDTPVADCSADHDLTAAFREHWAKNLPFLLEGYEEQPGLQPSIRDVVPQSFDAYGADVRELVCAADRLGSLMQYDAPGFLPNRRVHRAMGMAALEVMQTLQHVWRNGKVRVAGKSRRLTWRDLFDVAVKWRRMVDPDQPVLWLDLMPARGLKSGFNSHINLVRGHVSNLRYATYFDRMLTSVKEKLLQHYGTNPKLHGETRESVQKARSVEDLLPALKKIFHSGRQQQQPGFMVATKVPGRADRDQQLDGFTLTMTGDAVGNVLFIADTQTTQRRTDEYHSEIRELFQQFLEQGKRMRLSAQPGDVDTLCNIMLSMVYYFYNLMPLSRGSSVVAYTILVGGLLASGKEISVKIPKGMLVDLEAMTAGSPEAFISTMRTWIKLKSASWVQSGLPSVAETFPTLRGVLEVLNTDAASHCHRAS